MKSVVLDTHSLLWHLADDPQLSKPARAAIDSVVASGGTLLVPTVCIVEVLYLEERFRFAPGTASQLIAALDHRNAGIEDVPLTLAVVQSMQSIPRSVVPDMPDRIIAATALHLGVPLVTADHRIRQLSIATIW